ncbi:uncharacterized protein LOC117605001 isoform X2 [Osmia lignaria lignaria]|uniref:uncharacterized protein LOC117605001 isoform X2 n=1 Tax=Osmia lignaria lignaria TaxID=1437193 RepID=UPI0014797CB8|nr:uncharacterized protein LOC117605001 isoform X2 [Osmia lignaria]
MGNYVSKLFPYNHVMEKEEIRNATSQFKDEINAEHEIMLTPPLIPKTLPIDPRSITTGIERTPIEIVNCTPVGLNRRISAIPKHLQSKPYLETDMDKIMACLTPKKRYPSKILESTKLQFPDIPNMNEINLLTPVLNNANSKQKISPIQKERYKILGIDPRSPAASFDRTPILMPKSMARLKARSREDLHRQGSYDTDMFYPKFSYCEMSSEYSVPEIQALPDLTTCTAKSLDLNETEHEDTSSESESSDSICSFEIETVPENGEEPLENQSEIQITLKQNNSSDVYIKKDVESKELSVNDNGTIEIWEDTVVLDNEDVIITFDDNSITKDMLSLKLSKSENATVKGDTPVKRKKVKSDIKMDEKKVFSSNDKNDSESIKTRTPLGNRSNNEQMQTLLTKSPQQIFRNKGITPKMLQENTPPHKKYVTKSKLNGMQWDPDSTVVI